VFQNLRFAFLSDRFVLSNLKLKVFSAIFVCFLFNLTEFGCDLALF
jgi:hypothetical protein